MTPELRALSDLLTDYFSDLNVPLVVAAQAGLDTTHLELSDVRADRWWQIVSAACSEGKLAQLTEVAAGRLGAQRGAALDKALATALDSMPAPKSKQNRPQSGQEPPGMSDYRNDERRDARIDQMQRDMADMRVQMAGLVAQVSVLTEMVRKQSEQDAPSLSNAQFMAIMVAFGLLASIVFATVYYGGNR